MKNFLLIFGGSLLGIALAVGAYFLYKKFTKEKTEAVKKLDYSTVLKQGVDAKKEVLFLQNFLNSKKIPSTPPNAQTLTAATPIVLNMTGIFDQKTEDALFKYMGKKETTLLSLMTYKVVNAPQASLSLTNPKTIV